jgi:uncharacterized RDD family membrane protein YckC
MIRYATFGRRLWAQLLTIVVDCIVFTTIEVLTNGGEVWPAFAFWYLLHHVGLVVEGGTIGHRLAGLRVVREDGERVGVPHAVAREVSKLALSLPPLGMGFLWMLDQPRRQTWHDLLANSVVVRESTQFAEASPEWAASPPWRRARVASVDGGVAEATELPPTPPPPAPPAPPTPPSGPIS